MAYTIPETLPEKSYDITPGERKVFEYLKSNLPEDYIVYYNVPVEGYYPDFIIIGPDLGVFVIEVKDWSFNCIKSVAKDRVLLSMGKIDEERKNPIAQARDYVLKILRLAEKRSYISGKKDLLLRWGYGALFPNIKERELEIFSLTETSFQEALGSEFVFTGDDLKEKVLIEKIKEKMKKRFGESLLSQEEMDILRSIIYPELLISDKLSDREIMRIIDKKQEAIAKNLGTGHRIIRGVAGSGKTVILLARTKFLSNIYPKWKILVLCYNKSLAEFFKRELEYYKNVEVRTFHSWCIKKILDLKLMSNSQENKDDNYWEKIIPEKLLTAYEKDPSLRGEYQAILVDEGQDFAQLWYKVILSSLDRKTESLFIALDGSQTIYKRKVSWKALGIQIIGRTKILKANYRNTRQILESAYNLIKEIDKSGDFIFEENADYVVPEKILRDGPEPEFKKFNQFEDEKKYLVEWVRLRIKENPQDKIMILCLNTKDENGIKEYLSRIGIKNRLVTENADDSQVIVSTIHSAKGLESEKVIIMDANLLDRYEKSQAKRLLYIGMTRSRESLCVCYVGNCSIIEGGKNE